MKIKKIITILWLSIGILICVFCQNSEKEIEGWSSYQGELKWDDAMKKCSTLDMRLPTKEEWQDGYKKGLFTSWEKRDYLTSTVYDEKTIHTFNLVIGSNKKTYKDNLTATRCIK